MFAVIKTGGKQYKVRAGDILRIEKIVADPGDTVQFNQVLMLGGDTQVLGTPFVEGAAVQAQVVEQFRDRKVINFVKRRRKHRSKRTKGHRQRLTLLRVTNVLGEGAGDSEVKAEAGVAVVIVVPPPVQESKTISDEAIVTSEALPVDDGGPDSELAPTADVVTDIAEPSPEIANPEPASEKSTTSTVDAADNERQP